MKIGSNKVQSGLTSGLANSDKITRSDSGLNNPRAVSSEAIQSSAQVNISSRAKDIQRAKELAMAAPDVDMEKVAKFRAMIEKGEYKVDAKSLADKMVDDELLLASTQE